MEILRYITDHHPITVREVADYMAEAKGHARTTVLSVMERLRKKGHLTRERIEGVYHYSPALPKAQFLRTRIRSFVQQELGGSFAPFVAYMAEEACLTDEELKQLRELAERMARRGEQEKS